MSDDFNNNEFNKNSQNNNDNANKQIFIGLVIIIAFICIIAFIASSCGSQNNNDTEEVDSDLYTDVTTVDIPDESLLECDDTLKVRDVVFPINKSWSKEKNNAQLDFNTYSFSDFYISYDSTISSDSLVDSLVDDIVNDPDYTEQDTSKITINNSKNYCFATKVTYFDNYNEYVTCLYFDYGNNFYRLSVICFKDNETYANKLMENILRGIILENPTYLDDKISESDLGDDIEDYEDDEEETTESYRTYYEGQYKVGVDIPAGTYIAYPDEFGYSGYYAITSDSNGDDILFNNNFDGQNYFTVKEGQYLELVRCYAKDFSKSEKVDTSDGYLYEGQYIVGSDIAPGEYKLICTEDDYSGYYALTTDTNGDNIISNDNFNGERYVTISKGQFLELVRCKLKLK